MEPFRRVAGRALPLDRSDVDTDQIVPAEHLKRVERTGFEQSLFAAWRRDPDFVLNRPEHRDAPILIAGPNFGCGSSREHAVWALQQAGFRAVISPRFADIFRSNCLKAGLLPVELPAEAVRRLLDAVMADPDTRVVVDLHAQRVRGAGMEASFEVDPAARRRLLEGLDEIAITLSHEEAIAAYEAGRPEWLPGLAVSGAARVPGGGSPVRGARTSEGSTAPGRTR
ncbi:MAG: 3-isopropylmalate dehydratase small subunit [Actinobacteria bacterium]|nr:3-isopropylmalate dehydratase small subunit [Actinomycetota bacterium]